MSNTKEELIERGALNVLNKILEYGNDYASEWLKFIGHEEIKNAKKIKQQSTRIDLTLNTQDDNGIATFYYVLFQWWYNKVFFKNKDNRKVLEQFEKDVYSGLHVYSCQAKENVSNYIEMEQFMNVYISAYLKAKKNYKTLAENTRDIIMQKLFFDWNVYNKKIVDEMKKDKNSDIVNKLTHKSLDIYFQLIRQESRREYNRRLLKIILG